MAAYTLEHPVLFEETNLVGNVYFVNYVRWQGHCRERFLVDHAPSVIDALREGSLALVTVTVHAEFYGECFAGDSVMISMTQGDAGGSNRIHMNFRYDVRDQQVASGRQTVACMSRTGPAGSLAPCPVPDDLRRALQRFRG